MAIAAFYWATFAAFAVPAALLELGHGSGPCSGGGGGGKAGGGGGGRAYAKFRNNYLAVFSLMMAGDWLQGPYIYHLYEYYGFSVRDIGRLFIAGFAGSAVFGTVAGALADRYGRKRAALLYVATYSLSCATKHSPNYRVLLVGRLLGGVSTSLLFSVFEAWAVAAHTARGFDESLMADLFTRAVMLGNGVMAIASGLVGSWLVQGLSLGPVAPFDAAIVAMLAGGVIVATTWEENRGASGGEGGGSLARQFYSASLAIVRDERVALLGVMQALFEASMYTFVFLWTPALNPHTFPQLPHGLVFAIFMTASMVGTALAGRLMEAWRLEVVLQGVFWAGAALLAVPVAYHMRLADTAASADVLLGEVHPVERGYHATRHIDAGGQHGGGYGGAHGGELPAAQLDAGGRVQLLAFCGFEVLIGLFWPSMMALRARYVPEDQRSTIINIFRIPLNAFVCIILYKVSDFPLGVIFGLCCLFLIAAAVAQARFAAITAAGAWPGAGKKPAGAGAADGWRAVKDSSAGDGTDGSAAGSGWAKGEDGEPLGSDGAVGSGAAPVHVSQAGAVSRGGFGFSRSASELEMAEAAAARRPVTPQPAVQPQQQAATPGAARLGPGGLPHGGARPSLVSRLWGLRPGGGGPET
ncbi:MAG: hypothetical protein J3K34DRAFT_387375 [Monoraphidium minutum]|nr:MAG: hypothetical protein J3K34DRAFT_387375 [Monoraphidium minutum]